MTDRAMSSEARTHLERWPDRARKLFGELLDDAGSDLQRELLQRAVAAGHTAAEVHAFADELRSMSDEQAFEACTLSDEHPEYYSVAQLLHAQADPLFAFELRGGTIDPAEDTMTGSRAAPRPLSPEELAAQMVTQPVDLVTLRAARGFEADSKGASPLLRPSAPASRARAIRALEPELGERVGEALITDLLEEATRPFSLSWRERDVDAPGGLTMPEALEGASQALARGVPVPFALGPKVLQHRRLVLALQQSTAGKTKAWQLYDPLSRELVWTNEGDLLLARELPFANKAHRRITRVALPTSLRAF
jgi:hypothetical protein